MGNTDSKSTDSGAMKKMALKSIMEESTKRLTKLAHELVEVDGRILRATKPAEKAGWVQKRVLIQKNYNVVSSTFTMVSNALAEIHEKEIDDAVRGINSVVDKCFNTLVNPDPCTDAEIDAVLASLAKR